MAKYAKVTSSRSASSGKAVDTDSAAHERGRGRDLRTVLAGYPWRLERDRSSPSSTTGLRSGPVDRKRRLLYVELAGERARRGGEGASAPTWSCLYASAYEYPRLPTSTLESALSWRWKTGAVGNGTLFRLCTRLGRPERSVWSLAKRGMLGCVCR
jgi:hypothetical protein